MSLRPASVRRSPLVWGPLAAGTALLLAGCGALLPSTHSSSSASASASPAAASAATPSASATAAPASPGSLLVNLKLGKSAMGPSSLIEVDSDGEPTGTVPDITYRTWTVTGQQIVTNVATAATPSGLDVTDWAIGAEQDPASPASFVIATRLHTPASGLDPESWKTTLQPIDAQGAAAGAPVTFGSCAASCRLDDVTRFGSIALVSYEHLDGAFDSSTGEDVSAVSLPTGQVLWTHKNVGVEHVTSQAVILTSGDDPTNAGINQVSAVSPTTGSTIWTFHDPVGGPADNYLGTLSDSLGLIKSFEPASETIGGGEPVDLVDLDTGHILLTRYGSNANWAYDPATQRVVIARTADTMQDGIDAKYDLGVFTTGGLKIYGIAAAQYSALGSPNVLGALDGRAWIDGPDVFDTATGTQDPDSPKLTGVPQAGMLFPTFTTGHMTSLVTTGDIIGNQAVLICVSGLPTYQQVLGLKYQ